jgi:PIN domain nuclease of toxin-antitoxin system
MRLLLDSHVVIALVDQKLPERFPQFARYQLAEQPSLFVSIASIWELAIKSRLRKLDLRIAPDEVPSFLSGLGISLLEIAPRHVTATLAPDVPTKDPFDRLLIAQCQLEALRLVTVDRALADHPVTFR